MENYQLSRKRAAALSDLIDVLDGLTAEIESLEGDMATKDRRIDELEKELKEIEDDLQYYRQQVQDLTSERDELQNQLNDATR